MMEKTAIYERLQEALGRLDKVQGFAVATNRVAGNPDDYFEVRITLPNGVVVEYYKTVGVKSGLTLEFPGQLGQYCIIEKWESSQSFQKLGIPQRLDEETLAYIDEASKTENWTSGESK